MAGHEGVVRGFEAGRRLFEARAVPSDRVVDAGSPRGVPIGTEIATAEGDVARAAAALVRVFVGDCEEPSFERRDDRRIHRLRRAGVPRMSLMVRRWVEAAGHADREQRRDVAEPPDHGRDDGGALGVLQAASYVSGSMKKSDKAARIGTQLDALYPTQPIPLDHRDPFTLLVAVALSAQTTDKKVNEVTPALFARASTPAAMGALDASEILGFIRTVGLAPTKAKNLRAMSNLLVERHGGEVPKSFEALEALPGVGHKTASVVMVQAFGVPAFPVDTHIHRLAERWGLSDGRSVEQTERDLKALFPEESWARRHLQMIYFGREHCPARGHDATTCPICSWATPRSKRDTGEVRAVAAKSSANSPARARSAR